MLEPPKASNKTPPNKTRSDAWKVKRKVVEDRGGDGGSVPSDLSTKMINKRKTTKGKER
jgi:hypothetical protein